MATWLKIVVGLIAAVVTLLVLVVGGFALYYGSHRKQLLAEVQKPIAEGQDFGQGKVSEACMTEGFRQLTEAHGLTEEARVDIFTLTCLQVATASPEFCDGVPDAHEVVASARWQKAACDARTDVGMPSCLRLMHVRQRACHSPGLQAPMPELPPMPEPPTTHPAP